MHARWQDRCFVVPDRVQRQIRQIDIHFRAGRRPGASGRLLGEQATRCHVGKHAERPISGRAG
jgi:hypothetical protein